MYQLNFQVHGKRFVYKFVCDLKQLIGYSAAELSRLVAEAEAKFFGHKVKTCIIDINQIIPYLTGHINLLGKILQNFIMFHIRISLRS